MMVSSNPVGVVILVWNVEKRLLLHLNYYVIYTHTQAFDRLCVTSVENHFLNLLTLKLTSKILTRKAVPRYLYLPLNLCQLIQWQQLLFREIPRGRVIMTPTL